MITKILQYCAATSITIAVTGILVHDTKWDQAVTLAMPFAAVALGMSADAVKFGDNAHTHSERGSLNRAFASGLPRVLPPDDRRRHIVKRQTQYGDDIGAGGVIWPNAV